MAVLTQKAFLTESISTNQTITTIDFYLKTFIATGQTANITLTLPFAGGGAPTGCIIHAINKHATLNLLITYASGKTAVLSPALNLSFIFNGTSWSICDNAAILEIFGSNGLANSLILTDNNGSVKIYSNAYTLDNGATIKARVSGIVALMRIDGLTGKAYLENSTLATADGTVTFTPPAGQNRQIFSLGAKTGMRLIFNSTSTPPIIESGSVEVMGRMVTLNANKTLALSDVPAGNAMYQSFAGQTNEWYLTAVDEFGSAVYMKYFSGNSQLTYRDSGNITSMSIAANVATITVASTALLNNGDVVVLNNTDGGLGTADGTYRVDTIVDATHFTVRIGISGTPTYSGGTYVSQYRIITLHGTGSLTGIIGNDVFKFTPTLIYDPIFGGYYVDKFGTTKTVANGGLYRVIGFFYSDVSGNILDDMISFGQCKEKNDNYIESSAGSDILTATGTHRWAIPTSFSKLWGTDLIYTDDATNKFRINATTRLKSSIKVNSQNTWTSGTYVRGDLRKNGVILDFNLNNVGTVHSSLVAFDTLTPNSYIDFAALLPTATGSHVMNLLEAKFNIDI